MHFAQERQALADKVAWEFSLRSDLDRVPAVVADFLFKDWSLVIAHAQLTDTRGQLDPGGYLAVVTDLLWSVKRSAVLKEPRRLFEVVPGVLQTLRRGLEMLGKEPRETDAFFGAQTQYRVVVTHQRTKERIGIASAPHAQCARRRSHGHGAPGRRFHDAAARERHRSHSSGATDTACC